MAEEPVELGLVGEGPGQRGLARLGAEFELPERVGEVFAEPPADDDPVAHVVAGLLFHGLHRRTGPDERSPPCEPVHPGLVGLVVRAGMGLPSGGGAGGERGRVAVRAGGAGAGGGEAARASAAGGHGVSR